MTDVLFYHLTETPLERTLPDILEKSLQRNWRVLVKGGNKARLDVLDGMLWTYRPDSFLPHGQDMAEQQPIYLTNEDDDPNNAHILILVDGASFVAKDISKYERVCLMFDGNDPDALGAAREDWKKTIFANLRAVYWAQSDGRWVQKAENNPQ